MSSTKDTDVCSLSFCLGQMYQGSRFYFFKTDHDKNPCYVNGGEFNAYHRSGVPVAPFLEELSLDSLFRGSVSIELEREKNGQREVFSSKNEFEKKVYEEFNRFVLTQEWKDRLRDGNKRMETMWTTLRWCAAVLKRYYPKMSFSFSGGPWGCTYTIRKGRKRRAFVNGDCPVIQFNLMDEAFDLVTEVELKRTKTSKGEKISKQELYKILLAAQERRDDDA